MKKLIMTMIFIIFTHQKCYSSNGLPTLPIKPAATATILVTAIVPITCTVTATPIAFALTLTQNSIVTVSCTNKTAYHIELSAGNGNMSGVAATTNTRSMTSLLGNYSLPYKLCQDAACTKNWGMQDGTDTVGKTSTGTIDTYTVYGVIASGLNAAGGVYTDTVNVTVNY